MRHRQDENERGVTGDVHHMKIGGEKHAALSTGNMRSEENKTNSLRLIYQRSHAARRWHASLGSTAQRDTTELSHNQPEDHLRENTC